MYIMGGGPRYEVGSTSPSKTFGSTMLLIFMCGGYFRFANCCVITDSAYGFVEAMLYLSLWGITWLSSFRMSQRRGFLGLKEFLHALQVQEQAKKNKKLAASKKKEKRTFSGQYAQSFRLFSASRGKTKPQEGSCCLGKSKQGCKKRNMLVLEYNI